MLIHIGLVGHNSNKNVLLRVIEISPNRIGSGLGVDQSVELTSSRLEFKG
jgi:hypothetical protein